MLGSEFGVNGVTDGDAGSKKAGAVFGGQFGPFADKVNVVLGEGIAVFDNVGGVDSDGEDGVEAVFVSGVQRFFSPAGDVFFGA